MGLLTIKYNKNNFYFTILLELKLNYKQTLNNIAKKHNISKQKLNYYARQLKEESLIKKLGYGTWQITEKGLIKLRSKKIDDRDVDNVDQDERIFKLKRKQADLHKYNFYFPIIDGFIDFTELGGYEPKKGLKGWKPQYLDKDKPFRIKFRNNNNKSITAFVKSRKITDAKKIKEIADLVIQYTYAFFKRHGLTVDRENAYCEDIHIEVTDEVVEKKLQKGDQITVKLNKLREKITPKDPDKEAHAWADTSPEPSLGTDDPEWWDAFLRQPLTIKDMFQLLQMQTINMTQLTQYSGTLARDLNVHIPVLVENKKTMKSIAKNIAENTKINAELTEIMKDISGAMPENRLKKSRELLSKIKSLVKTGKDLLKYPDMVNALTTEDKYLLTDWWLKSFEDAY